MSVTFLLSQCFLGRKLLAVSQSSAECGSESFCPFFFRVEGQALEFLSVPLSLSDSSEASVCQWGFTLYWWICVWLGQCFTSSPYPSLVVPEWVQPSACIQPRGSQFVCDSRKPLNGYTPNCLLSWLLQFFAGCSEYHEATSPLFVVLYQDLHCFWWFPQAHMQFSR